MELIDIMERDVTACVRKNGMDIAGLLATSWLSCFRTTPRGRSTADPTPRATTTSFSSTLPSTMRSMNGKPCSSGTC